MVTRPKSFGKSTGSNPKVDIESRISVDFTPESGFSTENSRAVNFDGREIDLVNVQPSGEVTEEVTPDEVDTRIDVQEIFRTQDNLVGQVLDNIVSAGLTPELNDIFRSRRNVLNFVSPVDLGSVGLDRFFLSVSVVNLELVVVGNVVLVHELFDGRSLVPARSENFITTHMDVLVREEILDILEDEIVGLIGFIQGRIELVVVMFTTGTSNSDVGILGRSTP